MANPAAREPVSNSRCSPRALARGHLLPQHQRHVLLPVLVLDGMSRFIVHWEIHESMTGWQIERAREKFPGERPRIISDNGPQFIAKDFKQFIRGWWDPPTCTPAPLLPIERQEERWYRMARLERECIGRRHWRKRSTRVSLRRISSHVTCTLRWVTSRRPTSSTASPSNPVKRDRKLEEKPGSDGRQARQAARGSCLMACPAARSSSTWVDDFGARIRIPRRRPGGIRPKVGQPL